jgi:transketolase
MKTEEGLEFSPVQVDPSHCYNIEDAIRKFRMMVQKEGILQKLKEKEGYEKPSVIIAHTIPGKGVDFMEYDFHWHGVPPNHEQAREALHELRTLGGKIRSEHE